MVLPKIASGVLAIIALLALSCDPDDSHPLESISLPPGFEIEVYVDDVPNARQIVEAPDGSLFVGTRRAGVVYGIPLDASGRPKPAVVVARDLEMPSGLALRGDDLYIGATGRILRLDGAVSGLKSGSTPKTEIVSEAFPDDRHHGAKYLGFGPDGLLYVPVGAPCNICLSENPLHAAIHTLDLESGEIRMLARGVRNSVGFDWHPETGELWFTDNGRDMLGDDVPPEELNRAPVAGLHFGFPHVHAGDVLDPELGGGHDPADYVPPVLKMQAHAAALGMKFYTGSLFPERYRHAIFIAQHGSWNRTEKVGYQVVVAYVDDEDIRHEPFARGWLQDELSWGRPNDVLVSRDGSLLISDDQAGVVYRVSYVGG